MRSMAAWIPKADRRRSAWTPRGFLPAVVLLSLLAAAGACKPEKDLELPTSSQLEGLYGERTAVSLDGNVVDVEAIQPERQLRRGGELWAKVGPYFYLFSPQTQEIFQDWNGVAAVRVRTVTPGDREVARAMLRRDELTTVTWREAKSRLVRARKEGTKKPGYVEDLVEYGEEHTEYDYSDRYVQ